MNCPTCGLLNLPASRLCIHCKSPIDLAIRPIPAGGGTVIELNRAKAPAASPGGARAPSGPAQQSDWREQLSLKLERLKEKNAEFSAPRPDAQDDFRQREFVRPSGLDSESQTEAPARRAYHPLAEKALEKIDRVKLSTDNPLEIPAELGTVTSVLAHPETSIRRRRSTRRSEKPERIEIDLNQPTLPFESIESRSSTSREDQVQIGLAAAALGPRAKAGLIDGLFVFGCFLIFLLIVFFVPEFVLFSKSSFLGMSAVLLLIFLSYIGGFTALSARTLGMDHEQLEVVSYQGTPVTLQEARLRTFGYLVSLGCFGLGFLWAIFDPERLTWHDKISKTLVVLQPLSNSRNRSLVVTSE